jgi:integral membrane sensor domain MASE1
MTQSNEFVPSSRQLPIPYGTGIWCRRFRSPRVCDARPVLDPPTSGQLVYGLSQALRSDGLVYVPLPLLLWASLCFGLGGLSASLLGIALISTWNGMHGRGPFDSPSMMENVLSLKVLLCMVAVPLMLLAAVIADRRRT